MTTVISLGILWAIFICVCGQQKWQDTSEKGKLVVKTIYVPLYKGGSGEGGGGSGVSVNLPFKLGKKEEKQLLSELNQFLLKQQRQQSAPYGNYYNVNVRNHHNPQGFEQKFLTHNHPSPDDNFESRPRSEITNIQQPIVRQQVSQGTQVIQSGHQAEYSGHLTQQIYQQTAVPQSSVPQQTNQNYNMQQNIHQNGNYVSNSVPPVQHYQQGPQNTKILYNYRHSAQPEVIASYSSVSSQDNDEYQNEPSNLNSPPSPVNPSMQHQQEETDYSSDRQVQNSPQFHMTSPITTSNQFAATPSLSSSYQGEQNLQRNRQEQLPRTFQAYQEALSHKMNIPDQTNSHAAYHTSSRPLQNPLPSNFPSNFNSHPTTVVQHQAALPQQQLSHGNILHPTSESNAPSLNHPQPPSYQNSYHTYNTKNTHSSPGSGHYHVNSPDSSAHTSTVTHYHQQAPHAMTQQNHQDQVYTEKSSMTAQHNIPKLYNSASDTVHETYNVNTHQLYAPPPPNYVYPENQAPQQQQHYTANSSPQNVVVVYKNNPDLPAQEPQNYEHQRIVHGFPTGNPSGNILPKVNFKPVYGYNYN